MCIRDSTDSKIEEVETVSGFNNNIGGFDPSSMFTILDKMIAMVQPFANQKAENQMLKKELDDIDKEPKDSESSIGDTLLQAFLPKLLNTDKVGLAGVDNGAVEVDQDLLTKALTTLAIHDNQIDKDLYKLSQIAENDPKQFQTLINMLRAM